MKTTNELQFREADKLKGTIQTLRPCQTEVKLHMHFRCGKESSVVRYWLN